MGVLGESTQKQYHRIALTPRILPHHALKTCWRW
nr:MAG TPA_asm: hypothetical protein [Caudoviricetes sp.]